MTLMMMVLLAMRKVMVKMVLAPGRKTKKRN